MSSSKIPYKKLPGKKRKTLGNDTLWMADDHVLVVESTGFTESYKRFFFKDIQSITLTKTVTGRIIAAFQLLFIIGFGIAGGFLFDSETSPASIFLWLLTFIIGLYFLANVIKGSSVICRIQTAVQHEKITALNRIRPAKKAISRILPKIETVQGPLVNMADILTAPPTPSQQSQEDTTSQLEFKHSKHLHGILFGVMLIVGLGYGLFLMTQVLMIRVIMDLFFSGAFILSIIVIVKQSEANIHSGAKTMTWGILAFNIIIVVIESIKYFVITFQMIEPMTVSNQWELIKAYYALGPMDTILLTFCSVFLVAGALILGLGGFVYFKEKVSVNDA